MTIYALDENGYVLSELSDAAIRIGISVSGNSTTVPRTGNRFLNGAWINEADNRGNWYNTQTNEVLVITERGVAPPVGYAQGEPPSKSLALARADKRAEMLAAREASEFGSFVWSGHVFAADMVSRMRLQQAFAGAQEALATNDTTWEQPWKVANGSVVVLSAQNVFDVYRQSCLLTRVSHAVCEMLLILCDTMTSTVAEVEAITWPDPLPLL